MISDNLKMFLENIDGIVYEIGSNGAGLPIIGIGHLLTKSELSSGKISYSLNKYIDIRKPISLTDARKILDLDLRDVKTTLSIGIKSLAFQKLNRNQIDALGSFCFNIGEYAFLCSTLLKHVNFKRFAKVPDEFRRWIYCGGEIDPLLIDRRGREVKLWLTPDKV